MSVVSNVREEPKRAAALKRLHLLMGGARGEDIHRGLGWGGGI
jgi:hypothetical protein